MENKKCSGCQEVKSLDQFGRSKHQKDGLDKYCKACRREQYLKRKEGGRVYRHYPHKQCEECGADFQPTTGYQRFCSVACRTTATKKTLPRFECEHCGALYDRHGRHGKSRYCSRECWRAAKGDGSKTKAGYVLLSRPGAPGARPDGRILAHRFVMQEELGRLLYPDEDVHHINGVRDDNRIENLELWTHSQPRGQRVEDKVAWAKEILERYGDF